ncbi:MAG TPA: polysaccharide biosynthesis/export family protein [Gracilimonas sp.]|uniref:polysaccharide biosynthesis/export family protein n=1 Tax=Gracilimonas sp. TaxID=1974203 RepID=UPI002DAB4E45|nr:polysaccharide biosynthesis/export family protein [Gracilimonas sp.]
MQLSQFKIIAIGLLLFIVGCSSSQKVAGDKIELEAQKEIQGQNIYDPDVINPGDELEILVWQNEDFNTRSVVTSKGTVAIPLIGEVIVAGKTKEELDRELTEKLSRYIAGEIRLTISLISQRDNIISVFGAVSRAQNFPVVDKISLFELLSMAGGPSMDADLRYIKVYRRDATPQYSTINLNEYLEMGQLNPAIKVGPGDIVYVPREKNFVREFSGFLRDAVLVFGLFRAVN